MKTQTKQAATKLVKRNDTELKELLIAELKAFNEKCQFIRNNQMAQQKAA